MNNVKKCSKCKKYLPFKEFSKNSSRKYGLDNYCKDCKKIYSRIYYKKNSKKIINQTQKCYFKNIERNRKKRNLYSKKYYNKNKKYILEQKRIERIEMKKIVMLKYGGKCKCCGEKEFAFLTIDHINGGGNKHRKEIGMSKMYSWLIKNNFPKGFQVLCFNCNCVLSFMAICPHVNQFKNK